MKKIILLSFIIGSTMCWAQNIPPTIAAIGDQIHCQGQLTNIATSFNITDPDDTEIDAFFIQISEGYTFNEDVLFVNGSHPNISLSWDANQGKLSFFSATSGAAMSYTDLIAAVRDVVYDASLNTEKGEKTLSYTIGSANYLPSTDHYYEYVPALGITWQNARVAADARTYFGLKGYLATITSSEEAQLTGEQVAGAGWIGGSDEQTEGVWRWMTGPEAGTIFWNGLANGTTPNYANWNSGEPNQAGDEDYAHITDPSIGINGSWNDLRNTGDVSGPYQPKGYIVEYGGTPGDPTVDISASTKITIPEIVSVVTPSPICGSGSVTLEATALNGEVIWFDSPIATVPVFTGPIFTTPILNVTTNYYVIASNNGCLGGEKTVVTAQVNSIPSIDSINETTICHGESGTLSVNPSSGTVNWYALPTGGMVLANGNVFNTPTLTTTTTYYVDATSNGCTSSARTPVTITVQQVQAPTGMSVQEFCDIDNASLADLVVTGTDMKWYDIPTGGTQISASTTVQHSTTYYASQMVSGCESTDRLVVQVLVYETVQPLLPSEIDIMETCDTSLDGNSNNGLDVFDLTAYEPQLLNGGNAAEFSFWYYSDMARTIPIATAPEAFENTEPNEQTVYVRIENNSNTNCYTDVSFNVRVNPLPTVQPSVTFQNCDEDGNPDGFTNFNLNELNSIITNASLSDFSITYHASISDANMGAAAINPLPYNNQIANTIYGRVENNTTGCYDVAIITLDVSTTALDPMFVREIESCDEDDTSDGIYVFDLTTVESDFINQFPTGQNLTVHYYKNLSDAELEQNEIQNPTNYTNITPFSETLYVRVESEDNGNCFGIGPNLVLTVHPRPEFEVDQSDTFCLDGGSVSLNTFNPDGTYTYVWTDSNNMTISISASAIVSAEDIYTVVATSDEGCQSFPVAFEVKASGISTITETDITVQDLSNNNTITIDASNIGIGDYEFALDDELGPFQDNPVFNNVFAGTHTLYVRDKNGCGTVMLKVFVMGFPKFFTPNGDGVNDTWNVRGLSNTYLQNTTVFIYDRYGKLIKQITPTSGGWNGTLNGRLLAANDYWYVINLVDETGVARTYRGHFSLIR